MSYMHIDNLYKDQAILQFKECYAMEKIHGSSAHVRFVAGGVSLVDGHWEEPHVTYFAGGEKHERFVALFKDSIELAKLAFKDLSLDEAIVYGEVYGGKCQGMKDTYGPDLKFVAFEVRVGDSWLDVLNAEQVARKLGFDFVHYKRIPATIEAIDEQRDADSIQAFKNGMGTGKMREGIVLRPLFEVVRNNGKRVIAKHKRPEFCETRTAREVKPETAELITQAEKVADEFVTAERMRHVIDALIAKGTMCHEFRYDISETGKVIAGMIEDITREGAGEFLDSKEARKAIGTASAKLYKRLIGGQFVRELVAGIAIDARQQDEG